MLNKKADRHSCVTHDVINFKMAGNEKLFNMTDYFGGKLCGKSTLCDYTVFIIKRFPLRCRTTSVERSSVVKKTMCERFMNAKQAFALNGQIKRT